MSHGRIKTMKRAASTKAITVPQNIPIVGYNQCTPPAKTMILTDAKIMVLPMARAKSAPAIRLK